MNVGTQAAIKGALSARDLKTVGCQIELSNTYHLHVRPGDQVIRQLGGLHRFMGWDGCGKSRRKGSALPPIPTATGSLWVRKKA